MPDTGHNDAAERDTQYAKNRRAPGSPSGVSERAAIRLDYAYIDELGVSYKTVANTCGQLKVKLGAHNLAELIRMAIEYLASSAHQPAS